MEMWPLTWVKPASTARLLHKDALAELSASKLYTYFIGGSATGDFLTSS